METAPPGATKLPFVTNGMFAWRTARQYSRLHIIRTVVRIFVSTVLRDLPAAPMDGANETNECTKADNDIHHARESEWCDVVRMCAE